MTNIRNVNLFVFDTKKNFDKSKEYLGSSFKSIKLISDLDDFNRQLDELQPNEQIALAVHVSYTKNISGIRRFIATGIREEFPALEIMYISDGDEKVISHQMIEEKIPQESVYKYHQVSSNLREGIIKAVSKEALFGSVPDKRNNRIIKAPKNSLNTSNKVFIVHGRDEKILHQVARFLEKLNIEPIILFEKPGKGQTIIEKLETNSNVDFAIILMTPDDQGNLAGEKKLNPRARQNVVLEFGYFVGILGRQKVAVLFDESVELPSDYHGVEYIPIDASNTWHLKLSKEMKEAGLRVDLNNVI